MSVAIKVALETIDSFGRMTPEYMRVDNTLFNSSRIRPKIHTRYPHIISNIQFMCVIAKKHD